MAPVVAEEAQFVEVPVMVGVVSVFGLVFSVSLFSWICCQRKSTKANKTPPYKFVHMLKGVDIYPENLNSKKKFGANEKTDTNGKPATSPTGGRASLHLDLEKRDLNGNFTKPPHPKVRSSPDLDLPSPHPGFGQGGKEPGTPESSFSSQAPTPADKPQDKEGGLGTLFFSLEYNFEKKAFVVHIKEAHGLSAMDEQSLTSDPYIKLTILPEKKHKVKTRVLRKTLDPAFDETFSFYGIPYGRVPELALHFMVLSFDRFSRDEVIGETLVPLAGIDLSEGRVLMNREIIKRNLRRTTGRGELLLSLCYQSTTSTLTVVVLKARHLPKTDTSGPADPYVKVNLYQGKKRVCKKKTHVKKCSPNPVFNELFVFDVPSEEGLRDTSVELLLLDSDRTGRNPVIGRLLLGTSAPGSSGEHWREICDHPRRQIAKWHALAED
ncbi:synaptotagmin-4 [Megalops cyprinoides]|uniref:synaptotagmin-4 n=1 Tax=Megalops cyprinoides TaxID=118141 RepID=UPI001864390E|nr:synaptotagmin-4 [Megalops cyprinoides]